MVTAVTAAAQAIAWFREALFPVFCLRCRREGDWLCPSCELTAPDTAIQRCVFCESVSPYGQTCHRCARHHLLLGATVRAQYSEWRWSSLIQAWKYGGARDMDTLIVSLFLPALLSLPNKRPDLCIPVPLTRRRMADRGFNQSDVLARSVAQALGIPMMNVIKRVQFSKPQAQLTRDERRENIEGVFRCVDPFSVSGKRCLLVDDIITTGSTVEEASRVLRKAGAKSVWAIAIARSDIIK